MADNNEIWRAVPNFEGIYEVSNYGNVKTLRKNKIMSFSINKKGYCSISLSKDKIETNHNIHRLVAKAFILNIENKLQVNHINGIKSDNRVENLEWCTPKENIKHAWDNGLSKSNFKIYRKPFNKKTKTVFFYLNSKIVIDLNTGVFYDSISEASKTLGIKYQTLVSRVRSGNYNIVFA